MWILSDKINIAELFRAKFILLFSSCQDDEISLFGTFPT